MRRPALRRLQLDNCASDPHPHTLPLVVAALKHQIRFLRGLDLSVGAVVTHQEVARTPNVDFRNHFLTTDPYRRRFFDSNALGRAEGFGGGNGSGAEPD
jgi:hypothetical protein